MERRRGKPLQQLQCSRHFWLKRKRDGTWLSDDIRKLPETPDEWREKVSPVIVFPRLIAKSRSAFSKSRVIFKKPTEAKKAESF
jgi:hypothetical protein